MLIKDQFTKLYPSWFKDFVATERWDLTLPIKQILLPPFKFSKNKNKQTLKTIWSCLEHTLVSDLFKNPYIKSSAFNANSIKMFIFTFLSIRLVWILLLTKLKIYHVPKRGFQEAIFKPSWDHGSIPKNLWGYADMLQTLIPDIPKARCSLWMLTRVKYGWKRILNNVQLVHCPQYKLTQWHWRCDNSRSRK